MHRSIAQRPAEQCANARGGGGRRRGNNDHRGLLVVRLGQVFDPTFFDASGIDFPPQQCDPSCHTWFVGFIQGSPALGGGVVSATFTHPVSDLSLLVAPALQGTATYTLKAFAASGSLLASTSVTVTQDQGDPATIAYGYFPIALATLPAPATSFTLDNVLVRSSFPNTVGAIPYGVSTISFTPAASTPPSATFLAAPDLDAAVLSSTVIEGTSIKLALVNPSPAGGTFTYAFDCGSGAGFGPFGSNNRAACPTVDNGLRTVRGEIRDANGTVTAYSTVVTIVNQKPHVVLTTAQGSTSPLGSPRTVSGAFTDPGLLDAPWAWVIQWGDGSSSNGSSSTQGGAIPASHVYTRAGTFKISMTVTDKDGGTGKSNSVSAQVVVGGRLSAGAGSYHTCRVNPQGIAFCWGLNIYGQLGNGSTTDSPIPVAVSGGLSFTAVAGGLFQTCGLTTGGTAYCWGFAANGRLGNGTTTGPQTCIVGNFPWPCSMTPVAVSGGLSFTAVNAGNVHTCGLTTGGAAYCWGLNALGELGDGSTTDRSTPVAVLGGLSFATLSAGTVHTCGLTTGGGVYCWGSNAHGQLGNGSTTDSPTPVAVSGGLSFTALSAGGDHTCGLTTGGAAYCWGSNGNGQLGNSSTTDRSSPVAVSGGLSFVTVSAGGVHTCGLTTSGAAYCWGSNSNGQLGTGSTTDSPIPMAVSGGLSFATVSAGYLHTCGLTAGEAVYCWGYNFAGQLGDGTTTDRTSPVAVLNP